MGLILGLTIAALDKVLLQQVTKKGPKLDEYPLHSRSFDFSSSDLDGGRSDKMKIHRNIFFCDLLLSARAPCVVFLLRHFGHLL